MDEEIKILCVDDEQNVLNSLKRLFLDNNYTILTAPSGMEGLKILEHEHVQVIISDYRMPTMNGVEFLREVYGRWPNTVRIVLSGYADISAIVGAINEGHIYKFIPKPWNDDELKVTVSNAIERYFLFKKNIELTDKLSALSAHYDLFDSMPVGIIGINSNNIMVICNSMGADILGNNRLPLKHSIEQNLPAGINQFIEEVKIKRKAAKELEVNGNNIRLLGALPEHGNKQNVVILVLIKKDDLL